MSNEVCHHVHQMKGFFYIYFIKLSSVYTLVYQNKKVPKVRVAPFAQCAGQAIGQRGPLWEQIYLAYN